MNEAVRNNKIDGLNSLRYKVKDIKKHPYHTMISVDLQRGKDEV